MRDMNIRQNYKYEFRDSAALLARGIIQAKLDYEIGSADNASGENGMLVRVATRS